MLTVVGVMGSGEDGDAALATLARDLGSAIAREGWVLLNGGRDAGVMDASAEGAKAAGGLVVGVLPDPDAKRASSHLDIAIRTGLGEARNAVNVLSCDVVIALSGGAGTISEIALALKAGRPVVALDFDPGSCFAPYRSSGRLSLASTIEDAIALTHRALSTDAV